MQWIVSVLVFFFCIWQVQFCDKKTLILDVKPKDSDKGELESQKINNLVFLKIPVRDSEALSKATEIGVEIPFTIRIFSNKELTAGQWCPIWEKEKKCFLFLPYLWNLIQVRKSLVLVLKSFSNCEKSLKDNWYNSHTRIYFSTIVNIEHKFG